MAVTLFRKRKVINNITIINGASKKEEQPTEEMQITPNGIINQKINARLRGKMYGRRTINR